MGTLCRAAGLAALHSHAWHLPGDATHECGAGRDALPGLTGTMAERAICAAESSRTRTCLLLHLEHASHSSALSGEPVGIGSARKRGIGSAHHRPGAVDAPPSSGDPGTGPGNVCLFP